ncbi:Hypothetical predicted protein [Podarcis lilfordi]|uniref:Uncharacterized protein n=1 Tax=Podarcis lilfordi TaxID=74358 RepID=A0AA35KAL1_9SAUR|nr:Hypothetical predicted protein [Podarcis lilfordi]
MAEENEAASLEAWRKKSCPTNLPRGEGGAGFCSPPRRARSEVGRKGGATDPHRKPRLPGGGHRGWAPKQDGRVNYLGTEPFGPRNQPSCGVAFTRPRKRTGGGGGKSGWAAARTLRNAFFSLQREASGPNDCESFPLHAPALRMPRSWSERQAHAQRPAARIGAHARRGALFWPF